MSKICWWLRLTEFLKQILKAERCCVGTVVVIPTVCDDCGDVNVSDNSSDNSSDDDNDDNNSDDSSNDNSNDSNGSNNDINSAEKVRHSFER